MHINTVCQIQAVEFDKEDVHALDAALASFNVEQQAYHEGGNHVHRILQVSRKNYYNIITLYLYSQRILKLYATALLLQPRTMTNL